MKLRPLKRVPLLISATVLGVTILLRWINPDLIERVERVTYDLRVRQALNASPSVVTNLGFAFIDESTLRAVASGELGYCYGLYWPRQVYGRAIEELTADGAKAVAFDVVFGELRHDHPLAQLPDGNLVESDEYLAWQSRQAGNVVFAVTPDTQLPELFRTNSYSVADITTERDSDGVLRRVRAFRAYRRWHPLFQQVAADPDYGVLLDRAEVETNQIILPRVDGSEVVIPLNHEGEFELADFVGDTLPEGMSAWAKPFKTERVWHMGVVLASMSLGLNLGEADVNLAAGRITLQGGDGLKRVIPVDKDGFFLIDWCLTPTDSRLTKEPLQALLYRQVIRSRGDAVEETDVWRNKLVVVGSAIAGGNDLTDRGATPLQSDTLLVSKHWNVANTILTGRFIRRMTLAEECLLLAGLTLLTAFLCWQLRAVPSTFAVLGLLVVFVAVSFWFYTSLRLWVPLILPCSGAVLVNWGCLTAWRVVFEQAERRRVKSVFSKIVSPNVVNELLDKETLALGGARREISVFFADVRGFTEFTDHSHQETQEYIHEHGLDKAEAAAYRDLHARQALNTVNLYLATVADIVKRHTGTLDKYIGDCVMAFWGAPTPNTNHALACVRAAIDAQRAVQHLNQARALDNQRIDNENRRCITSGGTVKPLLPTLELGVGINTGMATVGLMGSDAHILNYTVFGREVNVASRLEAVSGRGKIIVSEATYRCLLKDDPALASTCIELEPVNVKGIRDAVRIYEVPWQKR